MAECKFTTKYWDHERSEDADYNCDSKDEDILDSGLCIFHDENYLQDKNNNHKEHEQKVRNRLETKIRNSIDQNEPLFCIGYHLPDITIKANFTKPVYFSNATLGCVDFSETEFSSGASFEGAKFSGQIANFKRVKFSGTAYFVGAEFSGGTNFKLVKFYRYAEASFEGAKFSGVAAFDSAEFSGGTNFIAAKFSGLAYFLSAKFSEPASVSSAAFGSAIFSEDAIFSGAEFNGETYFDYVLFEDGKKILFETEDLSKVSFMNSDITRVRFSETARWGKGKKDKDRFKVIEERWLEGSPEKIKNLGSVMAVYRNLRENYEFRLRYDEAGKFFIREMELKRKYREVLSEDGSHVIVKPNGFLKRNLSLTGLYYHLSRYGENLLRPTLIGISIVFGSTLFWLMQSNPYAEPSLSHVTGFTQVVANHTQWQKAFERSFADFLPLLPLGSKIQVGLSDYVIKILGGALTFGFIAIALRRKFERKYTR